MSELKGFKHIDREEEEKSLRNNRKRLEDLGKESDKGLK